VSSPLALCISHPLPIPRGPSCPRARVYVCDCRGGKRSKVSPRGALNLPAARFLQTGRFDPLFPTPPLALVLALALVLGLSRSLPRSPCYGEGEGEESLLKATAMNEVDAGRDRATRHRLRHDDVEPLTFISSCYCQRRRCQRGCEPLGLLTYCSVKIPGRDRWSVGLDCPSGAGMLGALA